MRGFPPACTPYKSDLRCKSLAVDSILIIFYGIQRYLRGAFGLLFTPASRSGDGDMEAWEYLMANTLFFPSPWLLVVVLVVLVLIPHQSAHREELVN